MPKKQSGGSDAGNSGPLTGACLLFHLQESLEAAYDSMDAGRNKHYREKYEREMVLYERGLAVYEARQAAAKAREADRKLKAKAKCRARKQQVAKRDNIKEISGDVDDDIHGNVEGAIHGNVNATIHGNVGWISGSIGKTGRITGNLGTIVHDVDGTICGDVNGHVGGNVRGTIEGSVRGIIWGNVHGNVGRVMGDVQGHVCSRARIGSIEQLLDFGGTIGGVTDQPHACTCDD